MIPLDWSPLLISLRAALLATILSFFSGLFAGRAILQIKHGKGLIDGILTLPLVLPPTVVGFFLLVILGRNSLIGRFFQLLDFNILFSWPATVLAAAFVSFPLMYRTARGAFEQLDPDIIHAARSLGLPERTIFWQIMLPNCWPGVLAGTVLAFARALGEFGATAMIAGNIPGRTQTISMAIYSAVQAGDRQLALLWSLITMLLSIVIILGLNSWSKTRKFPASHMKAPWKIPAPVVRKKSRTAQPQAVKKEVPDGSICTDQEKSWSLQSGC